MEKKYFIGIDIGGTWIRVAICTADLHEENIKLKKSPTLKDNILSISNTFCQLIDELLIENNIKEEEIIGIGLASAGPIDMDTGEVFNNANLGMDRIPLKKPLLNRYKGIPLYIANDCNAAVLGVHFFEADDNEKDNIVYVTMSTGIGGGVICNGHLLLGKEGNAGEIGHAVFKPYAEVPCNCGCVSCWEVFSSGVGIPLRTLELLEKGELNADILLKSVNNDKTKITAKEVFQAAREGDALSKVIIEQCIYHTKQGIGLINSFFDCSTVYLGGAMLKDKDLILPPIIKQFKEDPIAFTVNHPPEIKITSLGDEVGLRGALALVKYQSEGHPIVN